MESVSVRQLKNNPSAALKAARHAEFVVVTNRDAPAALLIGMEQLRVPDLGRLRLDCSFFRWRLDGREGVGRYDILRRIEAGAAS